MISAVDTKMTTLDDKFELYDLQVDVICLLGEKMYCGAKPADHFRLKGEMLHLGRLI